MKEEEILESLADYFNEISNEFTSIEEEDLPNTYDREIRGVSVYDVDHMLMKIKKPVPGDIPPCILPELYKELSLIHI